MQTEIRTLSLRIAYLISITAVAFALVEPAFAQDRHFVYTNDDIAAPAANTVTGFSVASNGSLSILGHFATNGTGLGGGFYASRRASVSRAGDLVFAANSADGSVSIFAGASTGSLVFQQVKNTGNPAFFGMSVVSDGQCIVIAGNNLGQVGSNYVFSYSLSNLTALSTPVSFILLPSRPDDLKYKKIGTNSYVVTALPFSQKVAVMLLTQKCQLTQPNMIATFGGSFGAVPTGVDFSEDGSVLYVGDANFVGTIVEAFAFPSGTPLAGSPYVYSSGTNSNTVLVVRNCLFVANQLSGGLSAIPLQSGGILGPNATVYPAGAGGVPAGMARDVNRQMLYIASGPDNTVTTEIIGTNCSLIEAPGTPIGTGQPGLLESVTAYP